MNKPTKQPVSELRDLAYQVDPALWVREQLKVTPAAWQETFLRAPRGASIIALTARQVGKTTTAAWAIAHTAVFKPGSLSVIACPAQRQSAEAVRRVHDVLISTGTKLVSDNVYGLELDNGSRVLALPGSDDFDPRLDGRRLDRGRRSGAADRQSDRGAATDAGASTRSQVCHAIDRLEPHRPVLERVVGRRPILDRLKATADQVDIFSAEYLEQERRNLGEVDFKREYLGIPESDQASPFTWELYERATTPCTPLAPPGAAFRPQPEAPAIELPNPFRSLKPTRVVS